MEARELRIGNYVYVAYSGTNERILGIIDESNSLVFNDGVYHGLIFKYAEPIGIRVLELYTCEPLPLTELWLLDFGFEELSEDCFIRDFRVITLGIYEPDEWSVSEGDGGGYDQLCGVRYVHELQNLWWAIYKKELSTDSLKQSQNGNH